MTTLTTTTAKQALADAMREWPQRVREARVTLADGRAYRPVQRNNPLLKLLDDPDKLVAEMKRILTVPSYFDPTAHAPGWDRVIAQAGPEYVWEWLIMDRTKPWADLFTDKERWTVAYAVAATYRLMSLGS